MRPAASSASPTCRSTPPTRSCAARPSLQLTADARPPRVGCRASWPRARPGRRHAGARQPGRRRRAARRASTRAGAERGARAGRPSAHRGARRDVRPLSIGARREPAGASAPSVGSRRGRDDDCRPLTSSAATCSAAPGRSSGRWSRSSRWSLPLMVCVAYLTLWERKAIGWTQIRPGPNRVGPLRPAAADRRRGQADLQGDHRPDGGQQGPVLPRPDHDHHAGAGRLGGDPLRPRRGAGQHQRRPAVPDGDHLDGGLRRHHRRLGVELEVRLPRRAARLGADGQLRDRDGLRAGRRADGRRPA